MKHVLNIQLLIFIFITFFHSTSLASNIDSLKNELYHSKSNKTKIELLFQIGKQYRQTNIDSAIIFLSKAEEIAKNNNYKNEQADILKNIGNCYHMVGDFDNAIVFYKNALKICLSIDSIKQDSVNSKLTANLYHNIAIMNNYKGNNIKAINLQFKAEEIRLKYNDIEGLAKYTYPNLGSIYLEQGEYSKASIFFFKALEIWEELKNNIGIADVHDFIGVINEKQNDYKSALEHYLKSLELRKNIGDNYLISYSYNNIGVAYFHLKEFDKSLEYYNKSLELKQLLNDKKGIRNTYSNIGLIYQKKEKHEKSLSYFFKSIEINKEFNDLYDMCKSYINVGTSSGHLKDYITAEKYLIQAFNIAKSNNYLDLIKDASENIALVYKNTKQYKKAFEMLLIHKEISDSIFNVDMIKKLTKIELNFEFDKKQVADSIKTAKRNFEKEIQHNENLKRQKIVTYSLIIGLILIIILAYLIFQSNKLKQKAKQNELKKKAVEIEKSLLRTQMNPHFIFNSMNSIQSFISKNDSYSAERYLSKFARLIRFILENSAQTFISFEDEISSLQLYLELEQLRFKHKFEFTFNINENIEDEFIKIPPMLIQPYIENAILHGIMHKKTKGKIKLEFNIDDNKKTILCSITDDGIGRKKASQLKEKNKTQHKSIGMRITNERLEILNKENQSNISVKITDLENESGTKVELSIPFIEI